MSFTESKQIIEEGDLVLAWVSRTDLHPITTEAGKVFQTRYGAFPHSSIIGKKFGSQIGSTKGRGFIHLLAPTPELWAMSLPHRTQIVYSPDASYIVQRLQIRPQSRVIEAGTGSGALTHALARTVSSRGHVFTYEYHMSRCEQATAEFAAHGLSDAITTTHRNVCDDGFSLGSIEPLANHVFLDLPAPWLAVPHLLGSGILDRSRVTTICCFSPCIEQIIKTLFALRDAGFQQMETVECQARRWEGHVDMVRTVDEAVDILRDVRVRRQEGIDRKRSRKDFEAPPTDPQEKRTPYNPWGRGRHVREGEDGFNWTPVSWMESEVKSHTSYLTFAVLPPTIPAKYATKSE